MSVPASKPSPVLDHQAYGPEGVAMGALKALTDDGLFIGQSQEFFQVLKDLAREADEARRNV